MSTTTTMNIKKNFGDTQLDYMCYFYGDVGTFFLLWNARSFGSLFATSKTTDHRSWFGWTQVEALSLYGWYTC